MISFEPRPGYYKIFRTYFTYRYSIREIAKPRNIRTWWFWVKDEEEESFEDESLEK